MTQYIPEAGQGLGRDDAEGNILIKQFMKNIYSCIQRLIPVNVDGVERSGPNILIVL